MKSLERSKRGPARDTNKERVWRRHVHRQSKSKLSVREYCAAAGISEPSFYAWRRSLARRDVVVGPSQRRNMYPGMPAHRRHRSARGGGHAGKREPRMSQSPCDRSFCQSRFPRP